MNILQAFFRLHMNKWYKLDNAAKLFPAVTKSSNTSIFRISAVINEPIDPTLLQLAVDIVIKRFPTLAIKIHRGLFWHMVAQNEGQLKIEYEKEYPCCPISMTASQYLLRVIYYNCRISVEAFHSLTDGTGAIEFLKSLVFHYLVLTGKTLDSEGLILLPDESPTKYEMEDSFDRYYQQKQVKANRFRQPKAYHVDGTPIEPFGHHITHGVVSSSKLNAAAKAAGATITAYLGAILVWSIYSQTMKYGIYKEPIKILIPVNLRKIFPSVTLRNFFSVVNLGINVTEGITFESVLESISAQLKEKTTKESLETAIAENMKLERLLVARFIPLIIKTLVIKFGFSFGERNKTITLTNMGHIKLPSMMLPFMDRLETILYPTTKAPVSCGVSSIGDRLTITFTRTIQETDILREFFNFLTTKTGLEVEIYSNEWAD